MEKPAVQIQLQDVQAHILRGAKPAAAKYYFLGIDNVDLFAACLNSRSLQQLILSESDIQRYRSTENEARQPRCFANLSFTYPGLQALGLPRSILSRFPPAFAEGMSSRAAFIGDNDEDSPEHWEGFYGSGHIHALLSLHFIPAVVPTDSEKSWSPVQIKEHWQHIDHCWDNLCNGDDSLPGSRCLMVEQAHVIRHDKQIKEHFGFADGISQPYVNDGGDHRGGGGKKNKNSSDWKPLAAGEFLLGYKDELALRNESVEKGDDQDELLPIPRDQDQRAYQNLTTNGSFLVYRKLSQDVKGFRQETLSHSNDMAELMVGRRQDGSCLQFKPGDLDNRFDFSEDENGLTCPFASHVRRANPRLTLNEGADMGTRLVDQHRLIRRGMPYGSFITPDADLDKVSEEARGLHFFCYNARIDSQFEFVQKNWLNNSDFLRFSSSVVDPICGNRGQDELGQYVVNQERLPVFGCKQYVHVKGGEYLFAPGLHGIALIAGLAQSLDPFQVPKQRIEPFDPANSDPFQVERFVDVRKLLAASGFVKLWIEDESGFKTPFYYFAKPEDVRLILSQPNVFTNDGYRQRIQWLTGGDMLLSTPDSSQRHLLKVRTWSCLNPNQFEDRVKKAMADELKLINSTLEQEGQIDLVEGIARRLPLAIVKHYFGVDEIDFGEYPYSKTQIAQYYARTQFGDLPPKWQREYQADGFKTDEDKTLLFWIRQLFLEVFGNQYRITYIRDLAKSAAIEFVPKVDALIVKKIKQSGQGDSVLERLIEMYVSEYELEGDSLVKAVRQSILELMVGSTDTTAKGIASVVKTVIGFGQDLLSGLQALLLDNPAGQHILANWLSGHREPKDEALVDTMLDAVITQCLRMDPVAPLLPRLCTNGATFTTAEKEVLNIESGAVVCLVAQATLAQALQKKEPARDETHIFMDGTPHGCMGHQIAMLEIREALKLLLDFPKVRPAAGSSGVMKTKYRMPASMWLKWG